MQQRFLSNIHWLIIGLVLIAAYFIGQSVSTKYFSTSSYGPSTFSVTGEAKYNVTAKSAKVNTSIAARAKTPQEAIQKNKQIHETLLSSLKGFGIDAKDIKTDNYQVYDYYEGNNTNPSGKEVYLKLSIPVKDLEKVGQVQDMAYAAGVTSVDGVDYEYGDTSEAEIKARQEAFSQAYKKAEQLAKVANKKLGTLVSISEYANSGTDQNNSSGTSSETSVPSNDGETLLSVTLTYELK